MCQSGYNKKVTYNPTDTNHLKNIVSIKDKPYGSTHFSEKIVSAKIGKAFVSLLGLYYPKNKICNRIFSRNKIKVSYNCVQNIKSILKNHNVKVLTICDIMYDMIWSIYLT